MKNARFWLWLVLILPVVAGFTRLKFDVDVLDLLPGDLPVVRGLKLYQKNFANSRELIVTLRAGTAESAESSARLLAGALRGQSNLVESVDWQPAWMERPAESAELIGYLWLNQPPELFAGMSRRLAPTEVSNTLAEAREQLATSMSPMDLARRGYDPYNLMQLPETVTGAAAGFGNGDNLFSSADGTFRIFFVRSKSELRNYRDCESWLKQVKAVVAAAHLEAGVQIGYTGGPAFTSEIARGMEYDMTASVGLTAVIIAVLFWLAHHRIVPMLWLLILLTLILACTLGLGGLFFGRINVVSLGFAAILLGLAVDYGVVHYQEALAHPDATIPEIRAAIRPSIFWAAITTTSAFIVLNFGGLPGLGQLGWLVAIGIGLSALVMLFAFLPPLFRDRIPRRAARLASGQSLHPAPLPAPPIAPWRLKFAGPLTIVLLVVGLLGLARGWPRMDHTADALRPRNSPAYAALDQVKANLVQNREPLWLLTLSRDEAGMAEKLKKAREILDLGMRDGSLQTVTLPSTLWPQGEFQKANRGAVEGILSRRAELRAAALGGGFTTNALVMTDAILDTWQSSMGAQGVFWPTNRTSRWILEKMVARLPGEFLSAGFIFPTTNTSARAILNSPWAAQLDHEGFVLSGWELLGAGILQRVQQNMWFVLAPMVSLVGLSLWFAFRRPREILLSLGVLGLSAVCLLAAMRGLGWSWNLLNLMAVPLMLGTGVDYSIFMQLALRRHHGDLAGAHFAVGRALLLCGGTAMAGFGSLSLSSNAGMASLGQVCAVGVGLNMLISVYLLPAWWTALARRRSAPEAPAPPPAPSSLYRARVWSWGLSAAKRFPKSTVEKLSSSFAMGYWLLARARREVVIENLLPALGDYARAEAASQALFRNFGQKLADLWHYENGVVVDDLFLQWSGVEHLDQALATRRGVLLLTPHLGNWEFGAPLLARRGVKLLVVTLREPDDRLTRMREEARARWGIETVVIGDDGFGVVEIIRRLEAGAVVALLIDRPPAASGIEVQLFGRPFVASKAAAELARASGCVLLPVYLPRADQGYAAHVLPEITYDRASLRDPGARLALTQKIVDAFEPVIRQNICQWYHFVPIWK